MSHLFQLMGYFHQDWVEDYESPKAAADAYLEGFPREEIQQALAQLRELLARNMPEDDLYYYLTHVLDCNYNMAADGLTPSEWLTMLAQHIEDWLAARSSACP